LLSQVKPGALFPRSRNHEHIAPMITEAVVLWYKIDFAPPLLKGNHEKAVVVEDLCWTIGSVDSGRPLRVVVRVRAGRFWRQTTVDEHQPFS
jgi:hypothetical protein